MLFIGRIVYIVKYFVYDSRRKNSEYGVGAPFVRPITCYVGLGISNFRSENGSELVTMSFMFLQIFIFKEIM